MKYSIILALALLSSPVYATICNNGGVWPKCEPPVVTPTPGNSNEQNQDQQQGQAQGQAQGQGQIATGGNGTGVGVGLGGAGGQGGQGGNGGSGTSVASGGAGGRSDQSQNAFSGANASSEQTSSQAVTNTNGGNTTASGASADGSGNADVTIGGDRYEGSSFVYQAAMPPAPPVFGPSSVATVSYGQCGPYKAVESAPVNGVYLGMVRKHSIPLGRTDRIVAYNGESFKQKQFPDGRWYLEGQMAVRTTTVLNVSGSRQVSLGGYGSNGGGQAGAGGGSSMQQLVSTIDLEPCVAYIAEPQLPVIEFKEPRVPRG